MNESFPASFQKYFESYIPAKKQLFPGDLGIKRTRALLNLLGSPQEKLKIIHVAGTSGKGSTCYLLSLMLRSQGFKVGLHLSPHLLDIRERFQVNNRLISWASLENYFLQFKKQIESFDTNRYGKPSYFELLVSFSSYLFAEENVDYAVMETGLGGLLDATNTVERPDKICVLTKIGLDHTKILGNTLPEIAAQKAGIIQPHNLVFSAEKNPECQTEFNQAANNKQTKVVYVQDQKRQLQPFANWQLGLIGQHQVENTSLALLVLLAVLKREQKSIQIEKLRQALKKASFPGRFSVFKRAGKTLILDGAHNPQKMESLLSTMKTLYPQQKFLFLLAFKADKDYQTMLKQITPLASRIILTSFSTSGQDLRHLSANPKDVARCLPAIPVQMTKDSRQALDLALGSPEKIIVVTGSLYLLSNVLTNTK